MNKKSMGEFIAALRKAKGYTQQELADRLGVSNKAVSRWERDECAPDISVIPALAEMLEVTCDELLRGEKCNGMSEVSERSEAKVDKQIKLLVKNTISRFKMMSWISMAVAVCGYIIMLGISYAFYRPKLAFAIMMIFEVAAAVLAVININRIKDARTDNDLLERADEKDMLNLNTVYGRFTFWNVAMVGIIVAISIPLICFESEYVESVLNFSTYVECCIPIWILFAGLYYLVRDFANKKLTGATVEKSRIVLCSMNGIQILLIGTLMLITNIYEVNWTQLFINGYYENWRNTIQMLADLLPLVCIIMFVVAFIICKKNKALVLVSGIRNIMISIMLVFVADAYVAEYSLAPMTLYVAIIITLILVAGIAEFILKKRSQSD